VTRSNLPPDWFREDLGSKVGAIAKDGRFLLGTTDEKDELGWQLLADWTMLLLVAGNTSH